MSGGWLLLLLLLLLLEKKTNYSFKSYNSFDLFFFNHPCCLSVIMWPCPQMALYLWRNFSLISSSARFQWTMWSEWWPSTTNNDSSFATTPRMVVFRYEPIRATQCRSVWIRGHAKTTIFFFLQIGHGHWSICLTQVYIYFDKCCYIMYLIQVTDLELRPVALDDPDYPKEAVHGSYMKNWPSIHSQGISRMNRTHIHLAPGLPGEGGVISGEWHSD